MTMLTENKTMNNELPTVLKSPDIVDYDILVNVSKLCSLLTQLQEKYNCRPTNIFNIDDTGITTVPKKRSKVIAVKGEKQVGLIFSAERGQLMTAVLCMSAASVYVSPLLFFRESV